MTVRASLSPGKLTYRMSHHTGSCHSHSWFQKELKLKHTESFLDFDSKNNSMGSISKAYNFELVEDKLLKMGKTQRHTFRKDPTYVKVESCLNKI